MDKLSMRLLINLAKRARFAKLQIIRCKKAGKQPDEFLRGIENESWNSFQAAKAIVNINTMLTIGKKSS